MLWLVEPQMQSRRVILIYQTGTKRKLVDLFSLLRYYSYIFHSQKYFSFAN